MFKCYQVSRVAEVSVFQMQELHTREVHPNTWPMSAKEHLTTHMQHVTTAVPNGDSTLFDAFSLYEYHNPGNIIWAYLDQFCNLLQSCSVLSHKCAYSAPFSMCLLSAQKLNNHYDVRSPRR